jgi:hypothetical protein
VITAAGLLALSPVATFAAGTDPTLALSAADAIAVPSGAVGVNIAGVSSFDDLMQFSFPAGVFVHQGSRFARFDFAGGVTEGNDARVQNGISPGELPSLLSAGSPAAPPAALTQLRADRIAVSLPAGFSAGVATAVVYAILEGDAFLSNPITFVIPPVP